MSAGESACVYSGFEEMKLRVLSGENEAPTAANTCRYNQGRVRLCMYVCMYVWW